MKIAGRPMYNILEKCSKSLDLSKVLLVPCYAGSTVTVTVATHMATVVTMGRLLAVAPQAYLKWDSKLERTD